MKDVKIYVKENFGNLFYMGMNVKYSYVNKAKTENIESIIFRLGSELQGGEIPVTVPIPLPSLENPKVVEEFMNRIATFKFNDKVEITDVLMNTSAAVNGNFASTKDSFKASNIYLAGSTAVTPPPSNINNEKVEKLEKKAS